MTINKNNTKDKLIKLLGFIVFSAIIIHLFLFCSYLFRLGYLDNRLIAMAGIKEEPANSIDVACIGGSVTYRAWYPAQAYRNHGFTSYDAAVSSIQGESLLSFVKYIQKYQNPDLYIIDARPFQYYDSKTKEVHLRWSSDALDYGLNRFKLIHDYVQKNRLSTKTDTLSLYLSVMLYHTNYEALKDKNAWELADNSVYCSDKGYLSNQTIAYLEEPKDVKNDERALLPENEEKTLVELLDYLKSHDLNALFVVWPYYITAEDYSIYNTVSDIISDYGYNFLNTNDYYHEMGIDFTSDFYDINHVNSIGTEKCTSYIGDYLVQNYNLPDHRGDEKYEYWQQLADSVEDNFKKWKAAAYKNDHYYTTEALQLAESIRNTVEFTSWSNLVNDNRFTVISVGSCDLSSGEMSGSDRKSLERIGLSDVYSSPNYIKVMQGTKKIASNTANSTKINNKFSTGGIIVPYQAENLNDTSTITIKELQYSCPRQNHINIVVFNNATRDIVDSVCLNFTESKIQLQREQY